MYEELAFLALFVFIYSAVAGRIEQGFFSGPIVFVVAGLVMGPLFLRWFAGSETSTDIRILADLTLALILFIDAANADLSTLKSRPRLAARMLLIGLPGAIALGCGLALVMFDVLTVFEAAILGTMLAATDAALGKAVVTNKAVPARIREGLNVESGLNDGLCVPVLLAFIAMAIGADAETEGAGLTFHLIVEEVGIGLLVGLGMTAAGGWILRKCWERGWVTKIWIQLSVVALALACFATAQSLHGSGYIAAFTGGLLFGFVAKESTHDLVHPAEGIGEGLALLTWVVFGAAVISRVMDQFTWEIMIYAVLSLTVVRMLPIYISLAGTGEKPRTRLFLGWFGPRGLASIVFAVIVLDAGLPGAEFMALVVVLTVLFSLIAHGITASPFARRLAASEAAEDG